MENENTRADNEGLERRYKNATPSDISTALQLGIEHSVGKLSSKHDRDVLMQDFQDIDVVFFPRDGSSSTPAHHHADFTFKTYAPIAFRFFRELFGIKPQDFMISMCDKRLKEIRNPGASGSLFFLTNDDRFIIKTVQKKEAQFLQELLPGYYLNFSQNKKTLLPKFFGLYSYSTSSGQRNIRIVVMNNLLPSIYQYQVKFDLKGSTYKRKASKSEREKKCPTLKDLDFKTEHPEGFSVDPSIYDSLTRTLERDVRVLRSFKIMDYSLLIGVHKLTETSRAWSVSEPDARLRSASGGTSSVDAVLATSRLGRIHAYTTFGEAVILFIGIIDILQSYRFIKKLEHTYKSILHDGDAVSVTSPGFYCERFVNFCKNSIFTKRSVVKSQQKRKFLRPRKSLADDTAISDKLDKSFNGPESLMEELRPFKLVDNCKTDEALTVKQPLISSSMKETVVEVHGTGIIGGKTVLSNSLQTRMKKRDSIDYDKGRIETIV